MGRRRVLVTGSSGHLGEALARTCRDLDCDVVGLDLVPSEFTTVVGSVADRELVKGALAGIDEVFHTAALQKPHIATHTHADFVETNVAGTLTLLEEAAAQRVGSFVFTSSTSVFGGALAPPSGGPATWVTEAVVPVPRNIYGVTKISAESLCELASRELGLPVVVVRTARFFPEPDDLDAVRGDYDDENAKVNELLNRRVDIEDAVASQLLAAAAAPSLGFARYVISATTPFTRADTALLAVDARTVVERLFPDQAAEYGRRGWQLFPTLDRVYDNTKAREELGWSPTYDFRYVLDRLKAGEEPRSALSRLVGGKGDDDVSTGVLPAR